MQTILLGLITVVIMIGLNLPAGADVVALTVKVDGLACPFCAYGLEKKLKQVKGIEGLNIDIEAGEAVMKLTPGTRLGVTFGGAGQEPTGLIAQVQHAVEESGFTPRSLEATVEGIVLAKNGRTRLTLSGTGESLVLEQRDSPSQLDKLGGDEAVRVVGTLHPEATPLQLTVIEIVPSDSAAMVCRLKISGIMCEGCVEAIQADLAKQKGVRSVRIDLESGIADIVVEDKNIRGESLAEVVNAVAMEGMLAGTFKATALEK